MSFHSDLAAAMATSVGIFDTGLTYYSSANAGPWTLISAVLIEQRTGAFTVGDNTNSEREEHVATLRVAAESGLEIGQYVKDEFENIWEIVGGPTLHPGYDLFNLTRIVNIKSTGGRR